MNRILLIDDDLNFRRSLIIHMQMEGYQMTGAESPSQALSILNKCRTENMLPDVVITDIKMPEMDGRDLASMIKNKYPELSIIMISAFDVPEHTLAFPLIKKPFKIQEFLNIIKKLKQ